MPKCWFRCSRCRKEEPFSLKGKCTCGGTLLVEYDLDCAVKSLKKEQLPGRIHSMWRYLELLPVEHSDSVVSLGEGWTPLIRLQALEKQFNVRQLMVKREEQNPTGSFKARGFSSAVSLLKEYGVRKAAVPSNGNAASALAAYAARSGIDAFVIVPQDCPGIIQEESVRYGAKTYQIDGMIHDAGEVIEQGKEEQGWFNVGTLREPGRVEGKKTMGLELAEQLHWKLPDVIVYPTGGGSGIIGLWKAFRELKELGWVQGPLPKLVSVQEEGCQPIVDGLASSVRTDIGKNPNPAKELAVADTTVGPEVHERMFLTVGTSTPSGSVPAFAEDRSDVIPNPTGLRVPRPPDQELIISILKETNGTAVAVSKRQIEDAQTLFGRQGISSSPEGAATLAGLIRLCDTGWIQPESSVVLFNTSHADKYLPWKPASPPPVIRSYQDLVNDLKRTPH